MKFEIFKQLEEKVTDYNACCAEALNAEQNARGMLAAVEKRIESNKASTEERKKELTKQINSPDKSETVRRIARMELDKLEKMTFKATEEERKAIADEILMSRNAMKDADRDEIKKAFAGAKDELENIRLQTVGQKGLDFTLIERYLDDYEEKLSRL
jgi:nucleoid-associated protein YejK